MPKRAQGSFKHKDRPLRALVLFLFVFMLSKVFASLEVAEVQQDASGRTFFNLRIHPQQDTKMYAPPKGSTGYPPRLVLQESQQTFYTLEPQWPQGKPWEQEGARAWVYDQPVTLPVYVQILKEPRPNPLEFTVEALVCSETLCMPVKWPVRVDLFPSTDSSRPSPLGWMLLWAFVGGLLLHLMPCVLPLLGLKMAQMASQPLASARSYYGGSVAGILVLFASMGALWALMKHSGHQWGWGMHFQSPIFLTLFIWVLGFFCAQVWGWASVRVPQAFSQNRWAEKRGTPWLQGCVDGMMMTVLATPCTAPFLGTALGMSLTYAHAWPIALTVGCIGVGFSVPYGILMVMPSRRFSLGALARWTPVMKHLGGWGILGLIAWLAYILWGMVSWWQSLMNLGTLGALLLVLSQKSKLSYGAFRLSLVLWFGMALGTILMLQNPSAKQDPTPAGWVPFETASLDPLHSQRPILLNVTARWCMTCHVNQRVWNAPEVQQWLEKHQVLKVHGDITQPNPSIENILHHHQRSGIPFAVIYTSAHPEGLLFPELLTVRAVLDTLEQSLITDEGEKK